MSASAAFQVNGATPTGAVAVAASSTVTLALLSTSGVNSVAWSIVGNHNSAAVDPTITPAGSPVGATASFPMPAGAGQAYLVQCVVNGGVDLNGDADEALTKRHIIGVNNAATRVPFCVGEELEREAVYGWTEIMNELSASATTGAVTPPVNPGDDGKVALASGGDLTYLAGTATYQPLTWNGTAWAGAALNLAQAAAVTGVLAVANGGVPVPANPADNAKVLTASGGTYSWAAAPTELPALGAANTVLRVNSGGVALEYAKLTTSNLDAAAGIVGTQLSASAALAATQLAAGGAGNVLLGGASNSWGQVTTSHISATAAIAASQLASGGANTVLQGGTPNTWTATPTVTSLAATYIALGADPADAGAIRLSHAMGVYGESNTPGTDRAIATWGVVANDTAAFGDAASATQVNGTTVELNGASATMIEATEVAAGRRVVSLCLGADLTTTEMPANTGDRVEFMATYATIPTAAPARGAIRYVDSSGNTFLVNEAGVHTQITP